MNDLTEVYCYPGIIRRWVATFDQSQVPPQSGLVRKWGAFGPYPYGPPQGVGFWVHVYGGPVDDNELPSELLDEIGRLLADHDRQQFLETVRREHIGEVNHDSD